MSASKSIFDLLMKGEEKGVRKMIEADRAVVHARDWVSCALSEIDCCLYCIVHVDAQLISLLYYIQGNNTPLHRTAEKGYTVVTQLLLQSGADRDAKGWVSIY
jgi:hypothetical protein